MRVCSSVTERQNQTREICWGISKNCGPQVIIQKSLYPQWENPLETAARLQGHQQVTRLEFRGGSTIFTDDDVSWTQGLGKSCSFMMIN